MANHRQLLRPLREPFPAEGRRGIRALPRMILRDGAVFGEGRGPERHV